MNAHRVKYLLIGGYAVSYYGYVRATADMDIWIEATKENAERITEVFKAFGFAIPELKPDLFLEENKIVRIGNPPIRIEVMNSISGVEFADCYGHREVGRWDDIEVEIISLDCLKKNKRASGRLKDLADLDYLP